ncbi:hypothetical protein FLL45_02860 [Aliikangiella marina]|uniref:Uncharacterized protein n=1 Tax=Aliikangiella marina TaxID=1712262 RepID=A0A545TI49_9GAMM|nr:hypothetical protein [Aliikangiella marina]TQV76910.1 hypothetical protein FLL45_02860 [Aliikangiella marina]
MIDGKFDVVFRGQIVKSFDIDTVKANLVKLFKSSPEAIERLFSGAETPIRKGLDYSAAMKYQSALKNAGALALIKEVEAEQPKLQSANTGKASFGARDEASVPQAESQQAPQQPAVAAQTERSAPATEPAAKPPQQPSADSIDGELSMAEVGAQILPDKVYEKRDVDTSSLSLAAAGERILPEKAPEHHDAPNIDHLKITDDTTPISGERER